MHKYLLASSLLLPVVILSGCASVNPCNGKHGGICSAPREVYGVTNNRDQVNPTKRTLKNQHAVAKLLREKPTKNDLLPAISTPHIIQREGNSPALMGSDYAPLGGPKPLLTQPRILRVWIAPWSRNGSLHFPGYVYTIVTPEKWAFAPAKGETPVPAPE